MDLKQLFKIDRLFDLQPPSNFTYSNQLLIWFGIIAVLAIFGIALFHFIFSDKANNIKRLFFQKIARYYLVISLLGLILVLARRQYIAFFSMRLFLLTLLSVQIGMVWYFMYEAGKEFPKYQKKYKAQIEKEKYLPKKKK